MPIPLLDSERSRSLVLFVITVTRGVFPNDDQYWRIEWVGCMFRNPKVPTESLVGVSVVPLISVMDDDNPTALEALNTDLSQRRMLRVGVGIAPSLVVGSIWRRHRRLSIVPYELREFEVDLAAMQGAARRNCGGKGNG